MSKDESAFSRAEEIAGEGKYEDIITQLRAAGVFSACVERTRNMYGDRINRSHFVMTERDFEMLAVLHLYDTDTALHSIRTLELADQIITRAFALPFGGKLVFGDLLADAGVSSDQFLRAALFHDIGKVIIPREILRNAFDDEEVLIKMFREENLGTESGRVKKVILHALHENGIRPIDLVPLKEIFTGEKYTELLCDLERRGFSGVATFKDVIRLHEPESKRILYSSGHKTEGELAGTHHNYRKEAHSHFMRTVYDTVAVADLIRIADITDALQNARWYKRPLSELEVLFILAHDADRGKINRFAAYLWINSRYKEIQEREEEALEPAPEKKEEGLFILSFLKEEEAQMESRTLAFI